MEKFGCRIADLCWDREYYLAEAMLCSGTDYLNTETNLSHSCRYLGQRQLHDVNRLRLLPIDHWLEMILVENTFFMLSSQISS